MKIDDQEFSEKLRLHASSLDLDHLAPVGDWTYGQSIRRAKEKSFFFDLSSAHFYPLGLNHPLMLKVISTDNQAQSFHPSLSKDLPHLTALKWTVLSENTFLKYAASNSVVVLSSFALTSIWGIKELEDSQIENLAIKIPDGSYFLCSKHPLPLSETTIHHGWIKLFLSPEVIGPAGRLIKIQQNISHHKILLPVSGLCFQVMIPQSKLHQAGIKTDYLDELTSKLCFPVSVLKSDIDKIAEILNKLTRSHAHS